jgi:hypothetical protein
MITQPSEYWTASEKGAAMLKTYKCFGRRIFTFGDFFSVNYGHISPIDLGETATEYSYIVALLPKNYSSVVYSFAAQNHCALTTNTMLQAKR